MEVVTDGPKRGWPVPDTIFQEYLKKNHFLQKYCFQGFKIHR